MRKKLIELIIIIVLIIAVIVAIFCKAYSNAKDKYEDTIEELNGEVERLSDQVAVYEEATKEIDIGVINTQIQNIGELATVEYMYTDAGKFEDTKQIFGADAPFTTKSFIAKWDGSIKAGVDVTQITAEVDEKNHEIIIHMPKAQILSHEIDEDSVETLDEKDGLFNEVKVDDVREFDAVSKQAMEQRAIDNGLLDKASENAKDIIQTMINTGDVKELGYEITFREVEEK